LTLAITWGSVLKSTDGPNISLSAFDTMVQLYYQEKISLAITIYTSDMGSATQLTPKGMTQDQLSEIDTKSRERAMNIFGAPETGMGSTADYEKFWTKLIVKLQTR